MRHQNVPEHDLLLKVVTQLQGCSLGGLGVLQVMAERCSLMPPLGEAHLNIIKSITAAKMK